MENSDISVEEKIKKIIRDEFDKELLSRQQQIEKNQEMTAKVQKLLHMVRYAATQSYYNNQRELETNQDEEENLIELIAQNRLHPAVKKLIGENPVLIASQRRRRKNVDGNSSASTSSANKYEKQNKNIDVDTVTESTPLTISESEKVETENMTCTAQFLQVKCSYNKPLPYQAARNKVKRTIIIGNISRWMPRDDQQVLRYKNNFTHKWMAYVRGPKEKPEVDFIEKVIFYLHPSFKPHDVFEVRNPPFHLTKVGWGEFPLKAQIHFKNNILNKPVNVIHQLLLPMEYPGKEVIGNETVIEVQLHEEISTLQRMVSEEILHPPKKLKVDPKEESEDNLLKAFHIDSAPTDELLLSEISEVSNQKCVFAFSDSIDEMTGVDDSNLFDIQSYLAEHSYSLPFTSQYLNHDPDTSGMSKENGTEEGNSLIHGLGDNFLTVDNNKKSESLIH